MSAFFIRYKSCVSKVINRTRQVCDLRLFQGHAAAFFRLLNLGYTDALRTCRPQGAQYSFWDYQAGAWPKDNGIRIDHLLLSPEASNRLVNAAVDRGPRGLEKASDHTPVWCDLSL